jgi:DNA processing protein
MITAKEGDSIMPNDNQLMAWLTLHHAPQLSAWQLFQLWTTHTNPTFIIDYLLSLSTLPNDTRRALNQPAKKTLSRLIEWQQKSNQYIITLNSPYYPKALKYISTPPPLLYLKGNPSLLSEPQVAIVGSRKASPMGVQDAHQLAFNLSTQDLVVTSGLALGIDAAAHQGALLAGKPTIAVLGSGVENIYPKRHLVLAKKITEKGTIISEFGLYAPPHKTHFPRRNRIISGLSLATLVVEANLKSGSLITAKYALEQGREVFAVPGSIHHAKSKGTHHLIQKGAYLVESYLDIMETLNIPRKLPHDQNKTEKIVKLDKPHHNLLECVDFSPTSYQKICKLSKLKTEKVTLMLLKLELKGYIKKVTGGFIRVKK